MNNLIEHTDIPADCDVRKIMLTVVPGEDGTGVEVYANNIGEVEAKLSEMGEQLEDWELGIRRHTASLSQPGSADKEIGREDWIEAAMRVYLIAGDTEQEARECANYQWGEMDMDDLCDPYEAAMSDVEERKTLPPYPDRMGMTYYKNDACKANDTRATDCICWMPQPQQCSVCGEGKAFTGTCGGGRNNPHALCYTPQLQTLARGENQ